MTEMRTKFPEEDVPVGYILADLDRWREEIEMIHMEMAFLKNLFHSQVRQSNYANASDCDYFFGQIAETIEQTKSVQQGLLNFSNRFEGMMECEDLQCETHFLNAYREFKTPAEAHLSEYKRFKKHVFAYLKTCYSY